MMLLIKFIFLLLSMAVGYSLGWYLTERNRIADKHELFKFKAFECRPCFSFHIAWVTATCVSLCFNDFIMVIIGILMALIMWWGLKTDEENKTVKLEDYDNIIRRHQDD